MKKFKVFVALVIVLLLIVSGMCLTACKRNDDVKDKNQIAFIKSFIISFNYSGDNVEKVREKLYDKNSIKSLNDFGWYHYFPVTFIKATRADANSSKNSDECFNYLTQKYPSLQIEAYNVDIISQSDYETQKTYKENVSDLFYLSKINDDYELLMTRSLYENTIILQ
jgi:hypothetical protein